jgi:hypothetical protein
MNKTIDVCGFITDSNVITPATSFFEQPKYQVSLQPTYGELMEIEQRIEDAKRMAEDPFEYNRDSNNIQSYQHKDRCLSGCNLMLESLQQPRLIGSIKDASNDGELYGRYVNVMGMIQVMPNGNAYLSVHRIQELPEPSVEEFG